MREPENVKNAYDSVKQYMNNEEIYMLLPQKYHRPKTEYIAILKTDSETLKPTREWVKFPVEVGFLKDLPIGTVLESRIIGGNECWNPAFRWHKLAENRWETTHSKNFPTDKCTDRLAKHSGMFWHELYSEECKVYITCSECGEEYKETEPEKVLDIEEDTLGYDKMTWICHKCGKKAHGYRYQKR